MCIYSFIIEHLSFILNSDRKNLLNSDNYLPDLNSFSFIKNAVNLINDKCLMFNVIISFSEQVAQENSF